MFGKERAVVKSPKAGSGSERGYNNFYDKIASERGHGARAASGTAEWFELFGALTLVNNLLITFFVEKCKKT
jgi:hypothetical protein